MAVKFCNTYMCFGVFRSTMERKNAELYWKNCQILMENKKLRRQAKLLTHENQMLLNEFHKKKAVQNGSISTTSAAAAHLMISLPDLNLPASTSDDFSSDLNLPATGFGTDTGSDPTNA